MPRLRNFPPKGTPGWSGPPVLQPVIDEIFARFPGARDFDPCECGITLAIVPPASVHPEQHFVIDDAELRAWTASLIDHHHLPNANTPGGVLILAERA